MYEDLTKFVDFINTRNFTWNAGINNVFSGHSLNDLKHHNVGSSTSKRQLVQVNAAIDSKVFDERLLSSQDFIDVWNLAKKYWHVPIDEFPESELPSQWDWRNVQDYDFTTAVRD